LKFQFWTFENGRTQGGIEIFKGLSPGLVVNGPKDQFLKIVDL